MFRSAFLMAALSLGLGVGGCASAGAGGTGEAPEPGLPGPRGPVSGEIPPDARPVDTERILDLEHSGMDTTSREDVRSAGRWERVWAELHAGRTPVPERPPVDFRERMVLVAAMGRRPTGGHSIAIEGVYETSRGDLLAVVRETSPGEGCAVTQAVTSPATGVSLPRFDGVVSFLERTETRDC